MPVEVLERGDLSELERFRSIEVFIRGMEDQVRIRRGDVYPVGGAVKLFEPDAAVTSGNDEMTPPSKDGFHDGLATSRFIVLARRCNDSSPVPATPRRRWRRFYR